MGTISYDHLSSGHFLTDLRMSFHERLVLDIFWAYLGPRLTLLDRYKPLSDDLKISKIQELFVICRTNQRKILFNGSARLCWIFSLQTDYKNLLTHVSFSKIPFLRSQAQFIADASSWLQIPLTQPVERECGKQRASRVRSCDRETLSINFSKQILEIPPTRLTQVQLVRLTSQIPENVKSHVLKFPITPTS